MSAPTIAGRGPGKEDAPRTELPTLLQQYVHKTHYSRWRDDLGRREHWHESVKRAVDWLAYRATKAPNGYVLTDDEYQALYDGFLNQESFSSMRLLMTAGEAAERDNVAIYNCVAGNTEILTIDGIKRIGDVAGTDQVVLDGDGNWTVAPIRSFGTRPLVQITMRPGAQSRTKIRHVIEATPDHRWITSNRGEVTDLRVGDVVSFVGAKPGARDDVAWVRGFGFGDGTHQVTGQAKVRLCGKKAEHLELVASVGGGSTCYPPSYGGDPLHIFHQGVMSDWKVLPRDESPAYLASWLDGYIAADGHCRDDGTIELASQDAEAIAFVKEIAPFAGYAVVGESMSRVMETNYGRRKSPLKFLRLRRDAEFKVLAIEPISGAEEVFCATVPTTGSFVLANGILTGNCTFVAVDDPRAFDEAMYLLMCGTGVGFSVERQLIRKLPEVPDRLFDCEDVIVVQDNRKSWASAYRRLLAQLWAGHVPKWDVSRIRPAGARLKTFGGRASGPAPLVDLFRYTIATFRGATGRRLNSLECHGLMCKIGDIVVSGGVRRSALISLSNPSDERMRDAKSGEWWSTNPHYRLANNSAVWTEKPDIGRFMREWLALYESKSGERGIINREALVRQCRAVGRATEYEDGSPIPFGVNPCGEIILRPQQCCNLTEVIVRSTDTLDDLVRKVTLATIMGTIQSSCTDFDYVRPIWKKNCDEEALLGVSMTGELDHPVFAGFDGDHRAEEWKERLRQVAREVNAEWASKLGINPSAMITCQKPSGTASQLANTASGGHARYADYYVRRTRVHKLDPIAEVVCGSGVPCEEDSHDPHNLVLEWPVKAPEGAMLGHEMTAIDQLERWLHTKRHFTEHNPSCTISISEDEWLEAGAWVYDHWDEIGGLSFLPRDLRDTVYSQAPFEEISSDEYERRVAEMPKEINWDMLAAIEHDDQTTNARELACSAGTCDIT